MIYKKSWNTKADRNTTIMRQAWCRIFTDVQRSHATAKRRNNHSINKNPPIQCLRAVKNKRNHNITKGILNHSQLLIYQNDNGLTYLQEKNIHKRKMGSVLGSYWFDQLWQVMDLIDEIWALQFWPSKEQSLCEAGHPAHIKNHFQILINRWRYEI